MNKSKCFPGGSAPRRTGQVARGDGEGEGYKLKICASGTQGAGHDAEAGQYGTRSRHAWEGRRSCATAAAGQIDRIDTLWHGNPGRFDRGVGLGKNQTTPVRREPEVLHHFSPVLRGGTVIA
jgi:hypothetical protein